MTNTLLLKMAFFIIVDLPMKKMDRLHSYIRLPEAISRLSLEDSLVPSGVIKPVAGWTTKLHPVP